MIAKRPEKMSEWFGKSTVEEVLSNDLPDFNWFAVRTRSRCEKKLSYDLRINRVRHYLPLYSKASLSGRETVTRELPLFSGYVFLYVDYDTRLFVEDNKSVANFIAVNQVNNFLKELKDIEKALQVSKCVSPIDAFQIGSKVRVIKGPMEGTEGEILRFKNKYILVLRASLIGQAISVEINATDTESLLSV